MQDYAERLTEAEKQLLHVRHWLTCGSDLNGHEWLMLAQTISDADLIVREFQQLRPDYQMPLLNELIATLSEATRNFTNPDFVRSTTPVRRQNKRLFCR
ncbi:MAG TPA: hypothetical protein VI168_03405 [Croceibacterium sp.]